MPRKKSVEIAKELIPGVIGITRNEGTHQIVVMPKSRQTYLENVSKGLLKGVAWEESHKVVLAEFGSASSSGTYLAVCWRNEKGDIEIVDFSKSYFNNVPTWHLAALFEMLHVMEGDPVSSVGARVRVYNIDPQVIGGVWKDVSNTRTTTGWVKFNPSKGYAAKKVTVARKDEKETVPPSTPSFVRITAEATEDQLVIDYMRGEGFAEEEIQEVLETRKENASVFDSEFAAKNIPSPNDPNWVYFRGLEPLRDGLDAYYMDLPLGLEGPPAGGKDKFWLTFAWMLNHPILILPCNGGMNESHLEGVDVLKANPEGKVVSGFRLGYAMEALKAGFIVDFDEVDALDPRYTFSFHRVGAGAKSVVITGYGTLAVHPKARLGATKNMGEEGAFPMNRAWRSRFSWLRLEPARDITNILLDNVPTLKSFQAEALNRVYQTVLMGIENKELDPRVMTIRGFIDAAKRMVRGRETERALRIGLLNQLENPKWADKVANVIERVA